MVTRLSPGRPKTSANDRQQLILRAASKLFADLGYVKTSIRLVAESAAVDPKLVMHYFGSKQRLFMSTVEVPKEVGKAIALLKLAPQSTWGRRITDVIWLAQKSGSLQTLVGVIRASASEPEAALMFRQFYLENLLLPIVNGLTVDHKELRAVMMSSLMAGYTFTHEIVGIEGFVSTDEKKKKRLFAAIVQTILTQNLT
jgi:AcrR family transcriptional regulator